MNTGTRTVVRNISTMHVAAASYAARGWPVFPCEVGGKRPLTQHGFHDATTDTDVIAGWWQRWPDANIGVPTGRATVDVLDVDHKADGSGWPAFHRARKAGLLAGACRLVTTPSGGAHVYFRPSGVTNHTLVRHRLDTRGDGGYVVVPPSVVNGVAYRVLDDRPEATGVLRWDAIKALLDPPASRPVRPAVTRSGGIGGLVTWCANLTEGNRNAGLFWACCTALENGHDDLPELVDAVVLAGLPQLEAERTAASARRRIGVAA